MKVDAELLCLLNANGIDIGHVPGGAHHWLDREAVLMALKGSSPAQFSLALYQSGVNQELHNLWAGLFQAATETQEYQKRFLKQHKGKLQLLVHLAIYEFTQSPVCKPCGNTGINKQYRLCKCCGGSGKNKLSLRDKARIMGKKSHASWYPFADMYAELMRILQHWEDSNHRKLLRLRA
jgi:hypothetical protein